MKIVTWNINSVKMRLELLQDFLAEHSPDVMLLQELKCENHNFPYEELSNLPYNCYIYGQKSYNGVAILSKFRSDEIKTDFPNNPCPDQARFIEIACNSEKGFFRVISLYAPNGGEIDSDKFKLKLQFYDALTEYLMSIRRHDEALIIGGDFNIAPFDIDVYSPEALANATGFTKIEKDKMRILLNVGFYDLYRLFNPNKQEFSWWDYRAGAFEQNKGMRIDTILASGKAIQYFKQGNIEYNMRAKNKRSDHAPVTVC